MTSERSPVILLLGKDGQVGRELAQSLLPQGRLIALGRSQLDLTDPAAVERALSSLQPEVIINAAAYTAVDAAEHDQAVATQVNADLPAMLAQWARDAGALLVHYSTDYVFDGGASRPYVEEDPTGPLNVYGQTKLEGECRILASGASYLIFRTCWVYGLHGRNFLKTMMRLMQQQPQLKVVDDQQGAPTSSRLIADVTSVAVQDYLKREAHPSFDSGIYHLSAKGETTWYGFARHIAECLPACFPRYAMRLEGITPVPTHEFPTTAVRPPYSVLDSGALERRWGLTLPSWELGVEQCVRQLASAAEEQFHLS